MIQYRRLAVLTLGVWMGAAIFADIAVTQNFQTVDRFLNEPGTPAAAAGIKDIGRDRVRALLRRNAAEENNFLFENTERAEIALSIVLALLIAFEPEPNKTALGIAVFMALLVVVQHFAVSPEVTQLGRAIDTLPPSDPTVKRFWFLHGLYSGSEIVKLLAGCALAARLCIRRSAAERGHKVAVHHG